MINKNVDFNGLNNIFQQYKENYKPIINEFTKIYTYEISNEIVAFVVFSILYEKCEIIDLFVLEKNRRKGLASLLINEILKDNDIENITLEVSKFNISAINFYKKIGFKEVAIRKNYYDNCDGILMLKEVR